MCHSTLPNYPVPPNARIIWMNAEPPSNERGLDIVKAYDYFENGEELHKKIAGALGPIVIRKVAEETPEHSDVITIWQYRKFVTRTRYGNPSPDYLKMYTLTEEMAKTLRVSDSERTPENFLLCPPVPLGNLYQQYVWGHKIPDLLRYVAIAVELGVLTPEESFAFFHSQHLISGGIELGSFPAQWWISACRHIDQVTLEFAAKHEPSQADDPYQKRAAAFCQERLGSYVLIKELMTRYGGEIPVSLFGTMHNVAPDGVYRAGV
jgi:hypothetical protein